MSEQIRQKVKYINVMKKGCMQCWYAPQFPDMLGLGFGQILILEGQIRDKTINEIKAKLDQRQAFH